MAAVSRESLASLPLGDLVAIRRSVGQRAFNAVWKPAAAPDQHRRRSSAAPEEDQDDDQVTEDEDESDNDNQSHSDSDSADDDDTPQTKRARIASTTPDSATAAHEKKKPAKRENKNRPMEVSSKKPVTRKRTVIEPVKKSVRDPRFQPFAGKYNEELFNRSYGFINKYEEDEVAQLRKELANEKDAERRASLQQTLTSIVTRHKTNEIKSKKQAIKRDWRKAESELVKQGKSPFYLKKSEFKKVELVEKYKELVGKGQDLDKVLEKRRKKNASREHRVVPGKRRSRTQE